MEGLCPSKPPRQRPGGLWKPGFWGGPGQWWWAPEADFNRGDCQGDIVSLQKEGKEHDEEPRNFFTGMLH